MEEGGKSHCFHGVKEGGQSSQTEFKRSTVEKWLPMSGGGGGGGRGRSLEYYTALWGYQVNFIVGQPKSSNPVPPAVNNERSLGKDIAT